MLLHCIAYDCIAFASMMKFFRKMEEQRSWLTDISEALTKVAQQSLSELDVKRVAADAIKMEWSPAWPTQQQVLQLMEELFPTAGHLPKAVEGVKVDEAFIQNIALAVYKTVSVPGQLLAKLSRGDEPSVRFAKTVTKAQLDAVILQCVYNDAGVTMPFKSVEAAKAVARYMRNAHRSSGSSTKKTKATKRNRNDDADDEDQNENEEDDVEVEVEEEQDRDCASFLAKLRTMCVPRLPAIQLDDAVPMTLQQALTSMLALCHDTDAKFAQALRRGAYIDLCRLHRMPWTDIAASLKIKAIRPDTCSKIANPHAIFKLIAEAGMHKLRYLDSDVSHTLLKDNRIKIAAHLKDHPEELAWWQEGQNAPRMLTAVAEDGKQVEYIDPKWLLGQ